MFRVAVLLSGRGSNFEAILREVQAGTVSVDIVGVVSDRADARGLEIAQKAGLHTVVIERRKTEQTLPEFFTALTQAVSALQPDLIVLAGFMRVVPVEMLKKFEGKMINIHPSLLPAYRGLSAQKQAIDAGAKFSGCTVHFVSPEIDAGEIIAQAVVPVFPDDSEETLSARILVEEHKLLPAVVRAIAEKRLEIRDGRVIIDGESRMAGALRSLELKT